MSNKTPSERLVIVNETKLQLLEHGLNSDPAAKVLWGILDSYHKTGTEVHCELNLKLRYDQPRKFVVDLWNNRKKRDTVLIRPVVDLL